MNESKEIPLTQGKVAKVSPADFEMLSQHKWHLTSNGYAARAGAARERIYMHRVINHAPGGAWVDHINHDKLDNTRENLRCATPAQSMQNSTKTTAPRSSIYKGVSFRPSRSKHTDRAASWDAYIKLGGKKVGLGHFVSEMDAALAYNLKAKEAWGDFAKLNDLPLDFLRDNPVPRIFIGRKHSKYRGVSWSKPMKKWLAYVCVKATRVHASFHETQEQAAAAYNTAALEHHGPEAKLNQLHAI